jgi:ABC-type multidrug transport system ATPase subunit
MALLGQPELISLDDPTSGRDRRGIREMGHLIARLPETHGVTSVVSRQLLGGVEQLATHGGMLHHGRLLCGRSFAHVCSHTQPQVIIGTQERGWAKDLPEAQHVDVSDVDGKLGVQSNPERSPTVNRLLVEAGLPVNTSAVARPRSRIGSLR